MREERHPQRRRRGSGDGTGQDIGEETRGHEWTRRRVVGSLAGLTAVGLGAGAATGARQAETTYVLLQRGRAVELTPLRGDTPVSERYDWRRTNYSSNGTVDLQRPDTSVLFLYEGPDGDVSLVVVHGELGGDGDGGSASFAFVDPPAGGSWRVRDDDYDGPRNYDRWDTTGAVHRVDWTWAGGRTDGGVYGPVGDTFHTRIVPGFNEAAALDGEYYDGTVSDWQALSGRTDPTRYELELDRPVDLVAGEVTDGVVRDGDGGDDQGQSGDRRGRGRPEVDDRPGRGPPDHEGAPGRGPPDADEVPGRGPPDERRPPSAEEIEAEVQADVEAIRERVRARIEAARERAGGDEDGSGWDWGEGGEDDGDDGSEDD